jgi:excisionase family DNA binding protein
MSHYCALLAARFGVDPESLKIASRLHDLGKFAIPDSILLKPGPLTADERADMERHAEIGHRLLMDSGIEVLEQAATIAWTHHERFDGSGYPRQLCGEEIPVIGRLAAVADVFEALTRDRVYRAAIPVDDALATLVAERGREFDPEVVDEFVARIDEVRAIQVRFSGEPSRPQQPAESSVPDSLITLQLAAEILAVSPSRLRRWSDDGRIEAVRTAGGHRRFSARAVHRLALERRVPLGVLPIEPPPDRMPLLAGCLRDQGQQMATAAVIDLYRGRPDGWFSGDDAAPLQDRWLRELVHGCDSGNYAGALHAADVLMRLGHEHGASLLERHSYLERFSRGALQALMRAGAGRQEAAAGRRLFGAIQQAHLAGRL